MIFCSLFPVVPCENINIIYEKITQIIYIFSRIGEKNNREHGEHRERTFKNLHKSRIFMFSVLFLSKIKRGTKIKNISKTFQKPIDILIFMCYIIRAVRGNTPKKERGNTNEKCRMD